MVTKGTPEEIRERRKNFVEALKNGNFKQTFCMAYDAETNSYCAIGVGLVAGKLDLKNGNNSYREFSHYYGLSSDETDEIWQMNDRQNLTLPEIGMALEKEWKLA